MRVCIHVCLLPTSETGLFSPRSLQREASKPINLRTLLRLENIRLNENFKYWFYTSVNTGLSNVSDKRDLFSLDLFSFHVLVLRAVETVTLKEERSRERGRTSLTVATSILKCNCTYTSQLEVCRSCLVSAGSWMEEGQRRKTSFVCVFQISYIKTLVQICL